MNKIEVIARTIARREIMRALGVMRPQREWPDDFNAQITRAVERTYPDYLFVADEIAKALEGNGF